MVAITSLFVCWDEGLALIGSLAVTALAVNSGGIVTSKQTAQKIVCLFVIIKLTKDSQPGYIQPILLNLQ